MDQLPHIRYILGSESHLVCTLFKLFLKFLKIASTNEKNIKKMLKFGNIHRNGDFDEFDFIYLTIT